MVEIVIVEPLEKISEQSIELCEQNFKNRTTKHLCPVCKKIFTITAEQKQSKDFSKRTAPYECPHCIKLKTSGTLICKTCGREFVLTDAQISYYSERNLHYPVRCKECLIERFEQRKQRGR